MTNPTQQNKEIMESFSGKFLGVWVDKKDIEQFLLSALEQKDQEKEKALDDFKAELAEKIEGHEEWKADEILTLLK